jgi:hypothetical protein
MRDCARCERVEQGDARERPEVDAQPIWRTRCRAAARPSGRILEPRVAAGDGMNVSGASKTCQVRPNMCARQTAAVAAADLRDADAQFRAEGELDSAYSGVPSHLAPRQDR